MKPNLAASRAVGGQFAMARPMAGARMVPFPPPVGRQETDVLAASASPQAVTADPYIAEVLSGLHAAACPEARCAYGGAGRQAAEVHNP